MDIIMPSIEHGLEILLTGENALDFTNRRNRWTTLWDDFNREVAIENIAWIFSNFNCWIYMPEGAEKKGHSDIMKIESENICGWSKWNQENKINRRRTSGKERLFWALLIKIKV